MSYVWPNLGQICLSMSFEGLVGFRRGLAGKVKNDSVVWLPCHKGCDRGGSSSKNIEPSHLYSNSSSIHNVSQFRQLDVNRTLSNDNLIKNCNFNHLMNILNLAF